MTTQKTGFPILPLVICRPGQHRGNLWPCSCQAQELRPHCDLCVAGRLEWVWGHSGIPFKLWDQLTTMSRGTSSFAILFFYGYLKCMLGFSDTICFRVKGWPNMTLQRLYWPLMLKLSLARRIPALPLSPHNVELSSIQVLGENQDLSRVTLSHWWGHI